MVESQESIAYFLDIVKIFPFHYKMQKRNNPKNKYNCFHDQSIFTRKISFFFASGIQMQNEWKSFASASVCCYIDEASAYG